MNILIKRVQVEMHDSYLPFSESETKNFLSVDKIYNFLTYPDYFCNNCWVRVILRIDIEQEIYERQVYNLADLISELGGFYSALFALGALIVSNISENILYT